jgi:hypothetical protein
LQFSYKTWVKNVGTPYEVPKEITDFFLHPLAIYWISVLLPAHLLLLRNDASSFAYESGG